MEVKSSVNDKDEFIDDMAYTGMVVQGCGFKVTKVSLLLISKEFRLGMSTRSLFTEIDHTLEVLDRGKNSTSINTEINQNTSARMKPKSEFLYACRDCTNLRHALRKRLATRFLIILYWVNPSSMN